MITKAEVENYSGYTIHASLNDHIALLIEGVTDYIERLCGNEKRTGIERRVFVVEGDDVAVTVSYDGNDLSRLPIQDMREITELTINNTVIDPSDYRLHPRQKTHAEYIELLQGIHRNASHPRVSSAYTFPDGKDNIKVTGKLGYSVTAPALVKMQALRLVTSVIKEATGDSDVRELTSESLGEWSGSYAKVSELAHKIGVEDALQFFIRVPLSKNVALRKL